jgi:hypothetical protein
LNLKGKNYYHSLISITASLPLFSLLPQLFKIAMDLFNRMQEAVDRYGKLPPTTPEQQTEESKHQMDVVTTEILNIFDLISFLIINKEISNPSIQSYFIESMRDWMQDVRADYPQDVYSMVTDCKFLKYILDKYKIDYSVL